MKKLVCGAAVGALLVFSVLGQAQAQTPPPAPIQPGTPPAAQTQAPAPTPYVVPMKTPPPAVKKTVRRKARVRSRSSSDNIANRLNAQELAHGGVAGGMAPHGAYGAPQGAYGGPPGPMPVAGPAYPPPPFYRPPPPGWYPPPYRPWGPWWRPWRPYGW